MRHGFFRFRILLLLTLFFLPLAAVSYAQEDYSALSFRMTASPLFSEKQVPVLSAIGEKAFARMTPKDSCLVIGQSGAFYRVVFQGKTGYVRKSQMLLKGIINDQPIAESLSDLKLNDYAPSQRDAKNPVFSGTIQAPDEIDTLYFFVWDARLQRVEEALLIPLDKPAIRIEASSLTRKLTMEKITAGRKVYVLEGSKNGETTVLFRTMVAVRGIFNEPKHVTDLCTVSSRQVAPLDIKSYWHPAQPGQPLTVIIPQEANAALLTLEWTKPPRAFTVETYDEAGNLLEKSEKHTGFYLDSIPLSHQVGKVSVFLPEDADSGVISLRVYAEDYPKHAVQRWEPLPEKLDLVAVSAHQDDELLFLGGTVPYACSKGKKVGMVYMANCGRKRYREALDGMWTAGLRYHPVFIGWSDAKVNGLKTVENQWTRENGGVDPRVTVVRFIRRHRPDVIVTQDFNGEYGHYQHRYTALLWADAVQLCKDPEYDPESVAQYGVWDVKKLYVHLYEENQIVMDWDQPLDDGTPFTCNILAKDAFDKHHSQVTAFNYDKHGAWYDNRVFGLYYSSVGPDEAKNDFFEHIPE